MSPLTRVAAVVTMSVFASASHAVDPAWTISNSNSATGNSGTHGTEFTPNIDIQVTALGIWDDTFASPDGLAVSHQVGLFRIDGTLIISTTIPAGTSTDKVAQFRYVDITPTTLNADETYVIATLQTGDAGRIATPGSTMTTDPRLTLGSWRIGFAFFGFPGTVVGAGTRFMGANFLFDAAPPPTGERAWTVPAPSNSTGNSGMHGTAFEPLEPLLLNALGVFDDTLSTPDGLATTHQVGLFDEQTRSLITSAIVPAGTQARKSGNFRFVDIAPVPLFPGVEYVVATLMTGDTGTNTLPDSSLFVHPAIDLGTWRSGGVTFGYPTNTVNSATRFMGANFEHRDRCPADTIAPFGVLDAFDAIEYFAQFDAQSPAADLAPPMGVFDAFDVIEYLGLFDAGCP